MATSVRSDTGERLLDLATVVAGVVRCIPPDLVGNHIAGQLIRWGTAPAAYHAQALSAESRHGLLHRLGLALEALCETRTWLLIVDRLRLVDRPIQVVIDECDQLTGILTASIRAARGNNPARPTQQIHSGGPS